MAFLEFLRFFSLVGVPEVDVTSAVGLKVCALTSGIQMYKSIIKKQKKKT